MARLFSPYDRNRRRPIRCWNSWRLRPFRSADARRDQLFVNADQMADGGQGRCSAIAEIRGRPLASACLPDHVRQSRSTARPIGTAAIPAIRRSPRWCGNAGRKTRIMSRQSGGTRRHAARGTRDTSTRLNEVSSTRAAQGAAHDSVPAPGMRSRANGEGALGREGASIAWPSALDGRARLFLKAKCRMGLPTPCSARGTKGSDGLLTTHGEEVGGARSSKSTTLGDRVKPC